MGKITLETGGGLLSTMREATHGYFELNAESSDILSFLDLLLPNTFLKQMAFASQNDPCTNMYANNH